MRPDQIVLWFTGLSGAGKTTVARAAFVRLLAAGRNPVIIDGDDVRTTLHKKLGFSREHIRENNLAIARLAVDRMRFHDVVLVPIISPYIEDRRSARAIVGPAFAEVYIHASVDACVRRDVKGLYRKAQEGLIDNLIGFSPGSPYEAPAKPDLELRTDQIDCDKAVACLVAFIDERQGGKV